LTFLEKKIIENMGTLLVELVSLTSNTNILKISKEQPGIVKRRTDNSVTKRNKRTNNDLQTSTQKTKTKRTAKKLEVNSITPGWYAAPVPLVVPVVLLLNDKNMMPYGNRVGHQYT
jgi:Cft2 family RNA processing exonuclease